jgi:putative endonuclease
MARNYIAVYIMANLRRTIYIGVTNDLPRRVYDHKQKFIEGYTRRYNLTKLVHYERYDSMREAVAREKQLKGWLRAKKVGLIETNNPLWYDLAADWFARDPSLRSG